MRCRKHPMYKGIRPPTSGCKKCQKIYKVKTQRLIQLIKEA